MNVDNRGESAGKQEGDDEDDGGDGVDEGSGESLSEKKNKSFGSRLKNLFGMEESDEEGVLENTPEEEEAEDPGLNALVDAIYEGGDVVGELNGKGESKEDAPMATETATGALLEKGEGGVSVESAECKEMEGDTSQTAVVPDEFQGIARGKKRFDFEIETDDSVSTTSPLAYRQAALAHLDYFINPDVAQLVMMKLSPGMVVFEDDEVTEDGFEDFDDFDDEDELTTVLGSIDISDIVGPGPTKLS